MLKRFILILLVFACNYSTLFSQPCSVNISGNSCLGSVLTVNPQNGTLSEVRWYNYGSVVFIADTLTTSTSVSIVAGGRGAGSAANQFGFPTGGIALDKDGNLYVADYKNHRIQKWAPGAAAGVTVAGGKGQGSNADQLNYPQDVFIDKSGNLYIADAGNHRIQKWIPGATAGTTVAGTGPGGGSAANQLNAPSGVYVDADGFIYIADKYNYRIQRWAPGAATGVTIAGGTPGTGPDQFSLPIDVYLDSDKNLYVADAESDGTNHRVQKWMKGASNGATVAGGNGNGDAANQLNYITAIFLDGGGNLYVADAGNRRVSKWAPGAAFGTTVAGGYGNGQNLQQLHYVTGVCTNAADNVYAMDGGTYAVKKFIPTNGIVEKNYTPQQAGSYRVEARFKNGCTAVSQPKLLYSIPHPEIKITPGSSTGNLCQGGIDTLFVDPWDEITTYKWQLPPGCSLVANRGDSVIVQVSPNFSLGSVINRSTNGCGTGIDRVRLTGMPLRPTPISGRHSVQANQTNLTYSVNDEGFLYTWTVPAGATITSGQHTYAITVDWGANEGVVSVTAANACGTSPKKDRFVSIAPNVAVSRELVPVATNAEFSVYPNPAAGLATLRYSRFLQGSYTIEITDVTGRVVSKKESFMGVKTNTVPIDLTGYAKGIYFITIRNNLSTRITEKIIKQ